MKDPKLFRQTQMIAFIPCYSWASLETVLLPIKMTTFGQRVMSALVKLQKESPRHKAYILWDELKRQHVVYRLEITNAEAELLDKVEWPDKDAILAALELTAYDSVDALCEVNDDIRTLLSAKEV